MDPQLDIHAGGTEVALPADFHWPGGKPIGEIAWDAKYVGASAVAIGDKDESKMLEMIAYRQGFGDVLAEGSAAAAKKIGMGSEAFLTTVKNLELAMHDPRHMPGMRVSYLLAPTGGDHLRQTGNQNGLRNQIEGGLIQSLSWTLKEEVKFDDTRILSSDWSSYPILTFSEVPPVEVVLIDRPGTPFLGAGEASQGPTGAALANAVFDATGVRLRQLPFTPERVKISARVSALMSSVEYCWTACSWLESDSLKALYATLSAMTSEKS